MAAPIISLYLNAAKTKLDAKDFGELHQKINAGDVQFCYAPVTYQQFKSVYRSDFWPLRKVWWIVSVPLTLVSAITALAVAALCLLFQSTPKAKACLFTAIRLCEASAGNFICLFNDRIGGYLITDAFRHIDLYLSRCISQEKFVKGCSRDTQAPNSHPIESTLVTV